jgi:hypothetical protein
MLFHRRQLRRWTALVLSTWFFGVVMSVANACARGAHAALFPASKPAAVRR